MNYVTTLPAQDIVQSLESGQLYAEVCIGENVFDGLVVSVPEPSSGTLALAATIFLVTTGRKMKRRATTCISR
jgi:hypothetical protein